MPYLTSVDEQLGYDRAPERDFNGRPPSYVPTRLGTTDVAYGKIDLFDEDVYDLGTLWGGTGLGFAFDGLVWKASEFGAKALSNAKIYIIDSAGNIELSRTFYDFATADLFTFVVPSNDQYYLVVDTFLSDGQYGVSLGVLNYPPYDIRVTGTLSIREFASTGASVGTLVGDDIDAGSLTYMLVDDAGGRFNINTSTGQLSVKNGLLIDFEQRASHLVGVAVMDEYGASFVKYFTVKVTDANPEVITGTAAADKLAGGASNDAFSGAGGNDVLAGQAGNDRLDGGAGADLLGGGVGNDTYLIDNAGDLVVEGVNQGTDTVLSSINHTLAVNVENLTLTGAAFNGAGNASNNVITGNAAANTLDGKTGADRLQGGAGNDTYVTDGGDVIIEAANQGTDLIRSSVSFSLGLNLENLLLTGASAINGTGNTLANVIAGNAGANILNGGAGHDRLSGGASFDSFVFNSALNASTNVDTIMDFNPAQDAFRLDNAVMAALGTKLGALAAGKFWANTTGLAHDADDRIIYETDTGKLFYDSNGITKGGSVHFATLSTRPALTHLDFVVI